MYPTICGYICQDGCAYVWTYTVSVFLAFSVFISVSMCLLDLTCIIYYHSKSHPSSSILMVMEFIQLLGMIRMKREKMGG